MERSLRTFTAPLAVGFCVLLLLARPAIVAGAGAGSLALVYAMVLAVALVAAAPTDERLVHPSIVLAIGLVAIVIVRARAGLAVPMHVGAGAIALNTAAAIAEEALFRRYLYSVLARWGIAFAIGGSALAFALVHVPAYGTSVFAVDLGAGLLLSWQRWACGTWTVPAATHAAANLLAVI